MVYFVGPKNTKKRRD